MYWTARRSNQSILREINLEYALEGMMLKLKLQYFGHLMQTADTLAKCLKLGKIQSRRRKGCQRMRQLGGITDAMDMNMGKLQEMVRDREALCAAVHGVAKTWLGDWTTKCNSENYQPIHPTQNHPMLIMPLLLFRHEVMSDSLGPHEL